MRISGKASGLFGQFEFNRVLMWLYAMLSLLVVNHGLEIAGVVKTSGWRSAVSLVAVIAAKALKETYWDNAKKQESVSG